MTDTELLEAYSSRRDAPFGVVQGEAAFTELMRRHGAMVYRACHRLLKDPHEAEDATQAVFVVLARKAGGLRKGDLAAWLYRVAHLVAAETVRKRMHRAKREEAYAVDEAIQTEAFAVNDVADPALLGLVDAALLSLPERYREAVILRYLQNHSEAEAAQRAGCAVGTLSARASRGIERLRQRLAKRGIALGGVALAGLLTSEASAAVPETLLPSILATVKTAVATTATATGATSTAGLLAKGAMKAMFIAKVKMVAAMVAASLVVAGSGAIVAQEVAQRKAADNVESLQPLSAADAVVRIPFLAKAPTIDGLFRAGEWDAASTATASGSATGASSRAVQLRFHLGYDKENLYVACYVPTSAPRSRLQESFARYEKDGPYAATNANVATAAKLPPLEASIWRLRFSCKVGEASNVIAVAGFFPDYEIPAWPANQPLPADEAALLAKAEELYAAGKYAEEFTQYAPISHSFPFSNIRQGRCLQIMGKPLLAIRTYDELLAFLPNQVEYSAPALFYRAQCHYLSGNTNEAIKALAQLVKDKDYAKHPAATAGRLLLAGLQAAGERP